MTDIQHDIDQLTGWIEDTAQLIGGFQSDTYTLSDGNELIPGLGMVVDARGLAQLADDICKGVMTLMVIGAFNSGKSTLINAMMGQKFMAVGSVPTTALVAVLVPGKPGKVSLYRTGNPTPETLSLDEFREIYQLRPDEAENEADERFKGIEHVEIEAVSEWLARGLRLVDSPGLIEHQSRNETTLTYLQRAQAIIFMLDANQLLNEKEREIIAQNLGEGRLDHVFFVVNRVNQVEDQQHQTLRDRLHRLVSQHFVGQHGKFDEGFYARRVFFLNAKGALQARLQNPIDKAAEAASKITELEAELTRILDGQERMRVIRSSALQTLLAAGQRAHLHITNQTNALGQPLETLRAQRAKVETHLVQLEGQQTDLRQHILEAGEMAFHEYRTSLIERVTKMGKDWKGGKDVKVLPLDWVKLTELLNTIGDDAAKRRLINRIQKPVSEYLERELENWSSEMESPMRDHMEQLHDDTAEVYADFQAALLKLQYEFADQDIPPNSMLPIEVLDDAVVQLRTGRLARGSQQWERLLQQSLAQLYLMVVVFILTMFNPVTFIAAIMASFAGANPFTLVDNFKKKVRQSVGTNLFEGLSSDLSSAGYTEKGNVKALADWVYREGDAVSKLLWKQLSSSMQTKLTDHFRNSKPIFFVDSLRDEFFNEFNRIVQNVDLYGKDRAAFSKITLSPMTQRMIWERANDYDGLDATAARTRLNRLLLNDAKSNLVGRKVQDLLYETLMMPIFDQAEMWNERLEELLDEARDQLDRVLGVSEAEAAHAEQSRIAEVDAALERILDELHRMVTGKGFSFNGHR